MTHLVQEIVWMELSFACRLSLCKNCLVFSLSLDSVIQTVVIELQFVRRPTCLVRRVTQLSVVHVHGVLFELLGVEGWPSLAINIVLAPLEQIRV